jgi:hypothetical protein
MEFSYAYSGSSGVVDHARSTAMSFAPDLGREPTYFAGELRKPIAFREAISALHDVVVSDLRFKPKDKSAYKAWAAQQELVDWDEIARQRAGTAKQIADLQRELSELQRRHLERRGEFFRARQRYFDYLYRKDRDAWFVLDPVITVHPDELSFECFSQDESTYGRLAASYEVFENVTERACGTTNIDYSAALYDEFQKIRSYKTTSFGVDRAGFDVKTTGEVGYREVKIDLPDSWVRGFLQVSSAMALPATSFVLHPMDVHDLCFVLRRRREKKGPRSLRFRLDPGQPIRVAFDPWGIEKICRRSIFEGPRAAEIRIWGRRRLHVLERLVPIAKGFTVHLLGSGMPSFWIADLGDLSFTLGLSGWTTNDWASAGNFDLLAPRMEVDGPTKARVFAALRGHWLATPDALAAELSLPRAQVLGALAAWTQAGRAIYDLGKGVYRARELARDPLPIESLRFSNEREEKAVGIVDARAVALRSEPAPDGSITLAGVVKQGRHELRPNLVIDADARIVRAECTCNFFQQNALHKGPCEHILATRLQHQRQVPT